MSERERDELEAAFGEVMSILSEGRIEPPTEQPGEHVWDAIEAELAAERVESEPPTTSSPSVGDPDHRSSGPRPFRVAPAPPEMPPGSGESAGDTVDDDGVAPPGLPSRERPLELVPDVDGEAGVDPGPDPVESDDVVVEVVNGSAAGDGDPNLDVDADADVDEAPEESAIAAQAATTGEMPTEAVEASDAAPPASSRRKGGKVVSLDDRRSLGQRVAIAVAAVAAVVLIGVPLALALGSSDDVRRVELAALGDFDGNGEAELTGRTLSVDLEGLDAPDGWFYELWLLDLDGGELRDLRSLGRVGADGSFEVPDDIDLDVFDVVDVSVEPDDGDPAHSGDSVLRGGLSEA